MEATDARGGGGPRAGGPGAAVPGRGLVDRRHARDDGRRRPRRPGRSTEFHVRSQGAAVGGHLRRRRPGRPLARRLAARRGASGPATSSCSSCPNWVEAGITFWAAAYLGAVVVPDRALLRGQGGRLHPRRHRARRRRHRRPLRPHRPPGHLRRRCSPTGPAPAWLVVGDTPGSGAARRAPTPFADLLDGDPIAGPAAGRPRRAGAHRLHLGHDPGPQGRHPLAPHDRLRDPPARPHVPRRADRRRSPARRSATSSGCSTRSSCPLLRDRPVNLVDVWDPGEVLRLMRERGPRRRRAAPPTSSPACSTTPTSPTSTWR